VDGDLEISQGKDREFVLLVFSFDVETPDSGFWAIEFRQMLSLNTTYNTE
jgi:hypothetical protein